MTQAAQLASTARSSANNAVDEAGNPPDRDFTEPAGQFSFGVCRSGVSGPICSLDPNSVPKLMDTVTPTGVSQTTELDPTLGPVQLQGVSP